ncbi:MAG: pilus assembly PilX N-terminal domain-containing protein [Patescibacteria group bacterium]|nr:pilus assembly PilX N-terminal domain-containing protein [Patescibacteria group bacterium]
MDTKNIPNTKYQIPNTFRAGTALLMTILILNSVILISLAAAKLIVSGVKESGTQSRSTKAYFAAEAGAEKVLYEYRKTFTCASPFDSCHYAGSLPAGSSYQVDWISGGDSNPGSTIIFVSVGTFSGLKRSVELDFYY